MVIRTIMGTAAEREDEGHDGRDRNVGDGGDASAMPHDKRGLARETSPRDQLPFPWLARV